MITKKSFSILNNSLNFSRLDYCNSIPSITITKIACIIRDSNTVNSR